VQTITRYNDEKIRQPPGINELIGENGFDRITLKTMVRSSLYKDEIWRPNFKKPGEPDIQTLLL
jgi:hypothetical protein